MQEHVPHFSLVRRWLLPHTGEVPLTRAQGWRIIITWALTFPVILTVATLPVVAAFGSHSSPLRVILLLLSAFLFGVVLFSVLAWFVVVMLNRSARFLTQQKERQSIRTDDPSGGRYGS